jgi:hypothetical protein
MRGVPSRAEYEAACAVVGRYNSPAITVIATTASLDSRWYKSLGLLFGHLFDYAALIWPDGKLSEKANEDEVEFFASGDEPTPDPDFIEDGGTPTGDQEFVAG